MSAQFGCHLTVLLWQFVQTIVTSSMNNSPCLDLGLAENNHSWWAQVFSIFPFCYQQFKGPYKENDLFYFLLPPAWLRHSSVGKIYNTFKLVTGQCSITNTVVFKCLLDYAALFQENYIFFETLARSRWVWWCESTNEIGEICNKLNLYMIQHWTHNYVPKLTPRSNVMDVVNFTAFGLATYPMWSPCSKYKDQVSLEIKWIFHHRWNTTS